MRETGPIRADFFGDIDTAKAHLGHARTLLGILKNRMSQGGLSQLSRTYDLEDGTSISVRSVFGQDSVIITSPVVPVVAEKSQDNKIVRKEEFATEIPTLWLSHTDDNAYEFSTRDKVFTGRLVTGMAENDCYQLIAAYGYLFSLCRSGVDYGMVLRRAFIENNEFENVPDLTVNIDAQDGFYNHLLLAFDGRVFAIIQCSNSFSEIDANLVTIHQINAATGEVIGVDVCPPSIYTAFLKANNAGAPFASIITRKIAGVSRNLIMMPASKPSTLSGVQGVGTTPLYDYNEASGILYYDIDSRVFTSELLPWEPLLGGIRKEGNDPNYSIYQYPVYTQEMVAYDRTYEPGGMSVDPNGNIWICTERRHSNVTDIGPIGGFAVVEHDWINHEDIWLRKSDPDTPTLGAISGTRLRDFSFYRVSGNTWASTWVHPISAVATTDMHAGMLVFDQNKSVIGIIGQSDGLISAYTLPVIRTIQLIGTDSELYGLARDGAYHYVFHGIDPITGVYTEYDNTATNNRYTRIAVHWDKTSDRLPADIGYESRAAFWNRRVMKSTNLLYL